MIKQVVIIGLCSILAFEALLPDVNLADLSHLPDLVSHFQKHRSDSPDLTFAEFLRLHYFNAKHLAATPKDHQDLPFSKWQLHRVVLQIAYERVLINPQNSYIVLTIIEGVTNCIVDTNGITSDVWQPPRA